MISNFNDGSRLVTFILVTAVVGALLAWHMYIPAFWLIVALFSLFMGEFEG